MAREAETLFSLVPRGVSLQAEIKVEGKDIGRIEVGQPVRLKFDAFPFQKYGTASGTVRIISSDSFVPEAKGDGARPSVSAYYRVLVDITDLHLRGMAKQFQIIPGMTVTAEFKAGRRSVISYFSIRYFADWMRAYANPDRLLLRPAVRNGTAAIRCFDWLGDWGRTFGAAYSFDANQSQPEASILPRPYVCPQTSMRWVICPRSVRWTRAKDCRANRRFIVRNVLGERCDKTGAARHVVTTRQGSASGHI